MNLCSRNVFPHGLFSHISVNIIHSFTCVGGLTGVHIPIDTPPPGLIVTRLLRLTPSVHYSQQTHTQRTEIVWFQHAAAELMWHCIGDTFSWCTCNVMQRLGPGQLHLVHPALRGCCGASALYIMTEVWNKFLQPHMNCVQKNTYHQITSFSCCCHKPSIAGWLDHTKLRLRAEIGVTLHQYITRNLVSGPKSRQIC